MWQATTESKQGESLKKLADYLAQTRRQAEASIDVLNTRIVELTREVDIAKDAAEHVEGERDYFRNLSEQLKLENSKKWRLQERDDWKSLVDSVQRDRARLQDECHRLETELEDAKAQVEALQQQQQQQQQQRAPQSPVASTSRFFFGSPILTSAASSAESPPDLFPSDGGQQSPRAVTKQLKLELAKAHAKLQVERAAAEATAASQESEISKLRQELERTRRGKPMPHSSGSVWARGSGGGQTGRGGGRAIARSGLAGGRGGSDNSWLSPLSLFAFLFSSTHGAGQADGLAGVLHV